MREVWRRGTASLGALAWLALAGCAGSGGPLGQDHSEYRALLDAQKQAAHQEAEARASTTAQPPSFDAAMEKADRLRRSGEPSQALWSYLQALRMHPESQTPRARIALLHLREDPARAEAILQGVVQEEPDSAFAHTALGIALLAQNRPEPARAALTRAVSLDPSQAVAFSALGVVHDQLGQHAAARVYQRRAQELRPEDPAILNNLGISCLLDGDLHGAEQSFRHAVALRPEDPTLRNNLGLALGRQHRYGEALEAFRRGGDEQAALNNLGYVHYLNGEYDQAIARYEQALLVQGDRTVVVLRNLNAALAARRVDSAQPPADAAAPETAAGDPPGSSDETGEQALAEALALTGTSPTPERRAPDPEGATP
jgi:Flp pilus assembly protein TadD